MAIDRDELAAAIGAAALRPGRLSLVAPGVQELPSPALPDWAAMPLADRRDAAARLVAGLAGPQPVHLRVAMPDTPGYRLLFAYLRRDWRRIGSRGRAGGAGRPDRPPAASTRSRRPMPRAGTCAISPAMRARSATSQADKALLAARIAPATAERQTQLAAADRILTALVPFIPLTAPVRWSLVSPRLTGFRPNPFALHPAVTLLAEEP